jgi:branched-chain amino acid transport system substrate-binding protein
MSKHIRYVAAAIAGVMAVATLAGCGSSNNSSSAGSGSNDAIVFGAVLPMTGPYASVGQQASAAFNVALDKINAAGGIHGKHVKLVVKDSGGVDVSQAVSAANELIDQDHVSFVWADDLAAMTAGIIPITTQAKIVSFTGGSSASVVNPTKLPYEFAFAVVNDNRIPATVCGGLQKAPGATKAAVVVTSDATGIATADAFDPALKAKGIDVVSTVEFDPTATDISAQLLKAKNAGAQFIVMQAAGTATGTVMRGVQALGWKVPVIGTNGSTSVDPNTIVPAAVQDQFSAVVSGYAARTAAAKLSAAQQAIADGFAKQGQKISSMEVAILHYDGLLTAAWGFEHAKSTSSADVTAELESLGSDPSQMPAGYLAGSPTPAYSKTVHDPSKSDYNGFFRIVGVSPSLDGTYVGTPVRAC